MQSRFKSHLLGFASYGKISLAQWKRCWPSNHAVKIWSPSIVTCHLSKNLSKCSPFMTNVVLFRYILSSFRLIMCHVFLWFSILRNCWASNTESRNTSELYWISLGWNRYNDRLLKTFKTIYFIELKKNFSLSYYICQQFQFILYLKAC